MPGRVRKVLWFVSLYLAGVFAVMTVGLAIRAMVL